MKNQPAIEVKGLKKSFRREFLKQDYSTWKTLFLKPFRKKKENDFITVLDGLDFSMDGGKTLAIIGQNGSGKSTLLKILAGIYKPDEGKVAVNGRVSSLIELGAGFHPEFTGRENVYLNGTILGMSRKELDKRLDHIIAYSGLGEYIDAPVRTYSSGMYVRLGFSVAVNVDPDVLLVDEVLAVGDEAFAHKCEDKIKEFRRKGKTIVLVTHDLGAVEKYANEVIWLDGGCIAARGEAKPVIDAYRQKVAEAEDAIRREECALEPEEGLERWGDKTVEVTGLRVLNGDGQEHAVFTSGDKVTFEISYKKNQPTDDLIFGVGINTAEGTVCYGSNTWLDRVEFDDLPDEGVVRFEADRLDLIQGSYFLDVAAHAKDGRAYDYLKRAAGFAMRSDVGDAGVFRPPHTWSLSPKE